MPELTVILAGVFGVGKSTIFKRIETGDFVQTPPPQSLSNSKSDGGIECYTYKKTIDEKEYNVSGVGNGCAVHGPEVSVGP